MNVNKDKLLLIERALFCYRKMCQQNEILARGAGAVGEKFWFDEIHRTTNLLERAKTELEGKK